MRSIRPRTYVSREMVCTRAECGQTVVVSVARPDKWRYCPTCLVIVTAERRLRNRANAKKKPRLFRYAGN